MRMEFYGSIVWNGKEWKKEECVDGISIKNIISEPVNFMGNTLTKENYDFFLPFLLKHPSDEQVEVVVRDAPNI